MEVLKDQLYTGLKVIKEYSPDSPDLPVIKLQGKFGSAEELNGNARKYKKETLQDKIIAARTSEAILAANPLFGEAIHPNDELTGEINPEKVTHKINWTKMIGDDMLGEIQLIPETPIGKIMYTLVDKYGAVPGLSSRAFGKMAGNYVDHDSFRYITHDITFNPSTPNAFLNKVRESVEIQTILKGCTKSQLQVINESLSHYTEVGVLNESGGVVDPDEEKKKKDKEKKDKEEIALLDKKECLTNEEYNKLPDESKKKFERDEEKDNYVRITEGAVKDLLTKNQLSSEEYQLAKKISGFKASDYEWDPKEKLYNKIKESTNNNKTKMEEQIQKLTQEVSKLSEQVGGLTKDKENLTATVTERDKSIKDLTESSKKVNGFYEKSLAVVEGLRNKLITLKSENGVLTANYDKALAVAEGLKSEVGKLQGHYGKAIKVIEGVQSSNMELAVYRLVEKELGDKAMEKYKTVFEGIDDMTKATALIKAIKEAAGEKGPIHGSGIREKGIDKLDENADPQSGDPTFESKVGLYS